MTIFCLWHKFKSYKCVFLIIKKIIYMCFFKKKKNCEHSTFKKLITKEHKFLIIEKKKPSYFKVLEIDAFKYHSNFNACITIFNIFRNYF